jgi:hypothetical protein
MRASSSRIAAISLARIEAGLHGAHVVAQGCELIPELLRQAPELREFLRSNTGRTLRTWGSRISLRALCAGLPRREVTLSSLERAQARVEVLDGAIEGDRELVPGESALSSEIAIGVSDDDSLLPQVFHRLVGPVIARHVLEHVGRVLCLRGGYERQTEGGAKKGENLSHK